MRGTWNLPDHIGCRSLLLVFFSKDNNNVALENIVAHYSLPEEVPRADILFVPGKL